MAVGVVVVVGTVSVPLLITPVPMPPTGPAATEVGVGPKLDEVVPVDVVLTGTGGLGTTALSF